MSNELWLRRELSLATRDLELKHTRALEAEARVKELTAERDEARDVALAAAEFNLCCAVKAIEEKLKAEKRVKELEIEADNWHAKARGLADHNRKLAEGWGTDAATNIIRIEELEALLREAVGNHPYVNNAWQERVEKALGYWK